MWRGLIKGAVLSAFGRLPGGVRLYRTVTREWIGTQATHVDKLARVWPGYVEAWERHRLRLDGADLWIHEGGWTPFPTLAMYLMSGRGGVVTNVEGRVLDRYLARAVEGVLSGGLPGDDERRRRLDALRWSIGAAEAIAEVGGRLYEGVEVSRLPLESSSVDLCHSGGVLEHLPPDRLAAFLDEARRVVRPGGLMSHVVDHRDHLHHADPAWPFLAHLALPDPVYRALCGHPLLYHNRLLPDEVVDLSRRAGFEPLEVRRMILPGRVYVDEGGATAGRPGIDRRRLAARFRAASEADLRTAAAHYLFRRPA